MPLRAFLVSILMMFGVSNVSSAALTAGDDYAATSQTTGRTTGQTTVPPDDDTTRPTINEFFPEDQALSDCLSSLPKPGCGSEARGGWRQTLVFGAIIVGLAFIVWRVVRQSRRARES